MRTKPTKAMLKATKKASAKDYAKMVTAASEVVMRNRQGNLTHQGKADGPEYVLIEFPYFIKWSEGFPKGVLVEKSALSNTYKVNAVRLLNWLYENGHSKYNAKQLVQQTTSYERLSSSIDRMFEILDK